MRSTLFVLIVLMVISCGNKKNYDGNSMINYPDMEFIMNDYLTPFEASNQVYQELVIHDKQKDSSQKTTNQIDWNSIHHLFKEANLYQQVFDKQYSISVIRDTLDPLMTIIYTSINPNNLVQKMSIRALSDNNKINSIYWETNKHGFMSREDKKVLFVVGKTIQIQEFEKKPLSKSKQKITQYNLLNP